MCVVQESLSPSSSSSAFTFLLLCCFLLLSSVTPLCFVSFPLILLSLFGLGLFFFFDGIRKRKDPIFHGYGRLSHFFFAHFLIVVGGRLVAVGGRGDNNNTHQPQQPHQITTNEHKKRKRTANQKKRETSRWRGVEYPRGGMGGRGRPYLFIFRC